MSALEFANSHSAPRPDQDRYSPSFNGVAEAASSQIVPRNDHGPQETWLDTLTRVVNGTYTLQKRWILGNQLPWDEERAQDSAAEMLDGMFFMRWLPPGRPRGVLAGRPCAPTCGTMSGPPRSIAGA